MLDSCVKLKSSQVRRPAESLMTTDSVAININFGGELQIHSRLSWLQHASLDYDWFQLAVCAHNELLRLPNAAADSFEF